MSNFIQNTPDNQVVLAIGHILGHLIMTQRRYKGHSLGVLKGSYGPGPIFTQTFILMLGVLLNRLCLANNKLYQL